jgi:hypothetical protein
MDDFPFPIIRVTRHLMDDGAMALVITGNDPDAVWSAARDQKNATPLAAAPVLSALEPAAALGWWVCRLTSRNHVSLH